MASLLDRKLIVVTGKGGTGKTTVACALGLLAARRGLRTIVAELGGQHRLPALFDRTEPLAGVELELEQNLWSTSIDPDRALLEWLRTLGGRISVRMLAASSSFQYFAAAAPGAKELVSMVKVRGLSEGQGTGNDESGYDLVVLDAPATGHALGMLRSPQTFASIVRVGPLAEQALRVRELLEDPLRSAYVAVAQGTEMAVTETLELEQGLRDHLNRHLDLIVVNATVPRRFNHEELERIAGATGDGLSGGPAEGTALARSAGLVANAMHERARVQQNQIARLRRSRLGNGIHTSAVTIPFVFTPALDLDGVRDIAGRLERKL